MRSDASLLLEDELGLVALQFKHCFNELGTDQITEPPSLQVHRVLGNSTVFILVTAVSPPCLQHQCVQIKNTPMGTQGCRLLNWSIGHDEESLLTASLQHRWTRSLMLGGMLAPK